MLEAQKMSPGLVFSQLVSQIYPYGFESETNFLLLRSQDGGSYLIFHSQFESIRKQKPLSQNSLMAP